jgi:ubiquinone biosynthesis monooxygenase Coq7
MRQLSNTDRWIDFLGQGLAAAAGEVPSGRPSPSATTSAPDLTNEERSLSGGLMRVNHVGEVCAQALYLGQSLVTREPELREHLQRAAAEERDHLSWTRARLQSLGAQPSVLNSLWFAGALAMGVAAGLAGRQRGLGFVVETERQVEAHLEGHLRQLPENDLESRAVVAQMQADEARHADEAVNQGAMPLPWPLPTMMRLMAKVMTSVAVKL